MKYEKPAVVKLGSVSLIKGSGGAMDDYMLQVQP